MKFKDKKIILLTTDQELSTSLSKVLSVLGMDLCCASHEREIFAQVKQEIPHVIVFDLNLSVIKDHEFLRFIEKCRQSSFLKSAPILILCSEDDHQLIHKAISLGAYDYMVKPVAPANFIKKILKAIETPQEVKIEFLIGERPLIKAQVPAKILTISENLFKVEVQGKLCNGHEVQVNCPLLEKFGIGAVPMIPKFAPHLNSIGNKYTSDLFLITEKEKTVNSSESQPVSSPINTRPFGLLVGDDHDFIRLTKSAFNKMGIDLEVVSKPDQLIAKLRQNMPNFCLIELNFNGINSGFPLLKAAKDYVGTRAPLYIISDTNSEILMARSFELGAADFLVRPLDYNHFTDELLGSLKLTQIQKISMLSLKIPEEGLPSKISFNLHIEALDENGLYLRTKNEFRNGTKLKLSGDFLNKLFKNAYSAAKLEFQYKTTEVSIIVVITHSWFETVNETYRYYVELYEDKEKFLHLARNYATAHSNSSDD